MNKSDFNEFMSANVKSDKDLNIHLTNNTRLGGIILKVFNDYIIFSGKNEEHMNIVPISSILTIEVNPPARNY